MKKTLLLLFLLYSQSLLAQQSGCADFRVGTFQYLDSNDIITIHRTEKRQVEISTLTKVKTVFRIKWTSDCTYELKQIWSDEKQQRKFNGGKREVNIARTDKDGYEFTGACKSNEGIPPFGGRVTKLD